MNLQSIVLSSVAMFSVSAGITVLGSYVAYLRKKSKKSQKTIL